MSGTWRIPFLVLGCLLTPWACIDAVADVIPIGAPDVHVPVVSHTCTQHAPVHLCTSVLAPDPLTQLTGPSTQILGLLQTSFPAYTFGAAQTPLTGSITVQEYAAKDYGAAACVMGAELTMTYVRGPNDPANLRWIQMVDYLVWEHPNASDPGAAIDPRNTPYNVQQNYYDAQPFYYPDWLYAINGLIFNDRPHMNCPCPDGRISAYFETYLVSYDDATPYDIQIHGGVGWGYDLYCHAIPEPTALALFGLGAGALALRRRRRKPA